MSRINVTNSLEVSYSEVNLPMREGTMRAGVAMERTIIATILTAFNLTPEEVGHDTGFYPHDDHAMVTYAAEARLLRARVPYKAVTWDGDALLTINTTAPYKGGQQALALAIGDALMVHVSAVNVSIDTQHTAIYSTTVRLDTKRHFRIRVKAQKANAVTV